jgi:acyl-CoA synthetase (NDP forming)
VAEPVDLVVVVVPAAAAVAAVDECRAVDAGAAVVLSSGFAEAGPAGRSMQDRLVDAAARSGVLLVGPNCQGVVHLPGRLVASFSASARPDGGAVVPFAYVGQSGALGGSLLQLARGRGTTLASWLSTGNQAAFDVTTAARYLLGEDAVHAVLVYLEAVPAGDDWRPVARAAQRAGKHLVVLRAGRSRAGRRAVASHTGALVPESAAFELACAEDGVILVDEVSELLDAAMVLTAAGRPRGTGVGIVSSSGGAGALAADRCEAEGLAVPALEAATVAALDARLASFASSENPVDVTAQLFGVDQPADAFAQTCAVVGHDANVDAVLIVLTNVLDEAAVRVCDAIRPAAIGVPTVVTWLSTEAATRQARTLLTAQGIPVVAGIGDGVRLLRQLVDRDGRRRPPSTPPDAERLRPLLRGPVVVESGAGAFLDAIGVRHPGGALVTDAGAATVVARASDAGAGIVVKAQSAQLLHKSEAGAVRVGVAAAEAGRAFDEIVAAVAEAAPDAPLDGVLVQPLVEPGVELLVGVLGALNGYPPVVTVGMGGVAVELYRDVASALAPLGIDDALALLRKLRGWPLLDGHRGRTPADTDAAAEAVVALAGAATSLGAALVELEVNPLIVHERGRGATAVDFLARLRS